MVVFSKFSRSALVAGAMYFLASDDGSLSHITECNVAISHCGALARKLRAAERTLSPDASDTDSAASASPVSPPALQNMFNTKGLEAVDISKIMTVMNTAEAKLKKHKIKLPPIPQFVVLGQQSAGKSRLIESIAGEKFNFCSGGTASRRPTRITFRKDDSVPAGERVWSITSEQDGRIGADGKALTYNASDLAKELQKIHKDPTKRLFSEESLDLDGIMQKHYVPEIEEDIIEVECRGVPYDLVITDYPGLMFSKDKVKATPATIQNREKIEKMVKQAFKDTRNRVLLLDEAKDTKRFDAVVRTVKEYAPGQTDFSRVTLIRTKLDKYKKSLKAKGNVNAWFRAEDDKGRSRFDKAFGMKTHALSCPSWTAKEKRAGIEDNVTAREFMERRNEMSANDEAFVKELQAECTEESQEKNDAILKQVGFDNFIRQLVTDVHALYRGQVKPVISNLEEKKADYGSQVADLKLLVAGQKMTEAAEKTPARFATALKGAISKPVRVLVATDEGHGAERTSSLKEDLGELVGKFEKDDLFSDDLLDEKERQKIYRLENTPGVCAEQIKQAREDREKVRTREYEAVKDYMKSHLDNKLGEDVDDLVMKKHNVDDPKGFPSSFSKYERLLEDVVRYISGADPAFPEVVDQQFENGPDAGENNRQIVHDLVKNQGRNMLMHHITVVGRRVKDLLLEAGPRTKTLMTKTLPLLLQFAPDTGRKWLGDGWEDLMLTQIQNERVSKAVMEHYERYVHQLYKNFLQDYRDQLDTMLSDPFSLLKTAVFNNNAEPSLFSVDETEVERKVREIEEAKTDSEDSASSDAEEMPEEFAAALEGTLEISGSDDESVVFVKDDDAAAAAPAVEAEKGETVEKVETGKSEEELDFLRTVKDDKRSIDIRNEVSNFFDTLPGSATERRWANLTSTKKSVKQLGSLLFMFAKNKIAESLKVQIDRHFYKKLVKNLESGVNGADEKEEGLLQHMEKMPKNCFKVDGEAIKQHEADLKEVTAKLNCVNEQLGNFRNLLD